MLRRRRGNSQLGWRWGGALAGFPPVSSAASEVEIKGSMRNPLKHKAGPPPHMGPAICPRVERDRPRCQLCLLPPPRVMNVITLAAPACLLWMALVIYRGEPRAIGHLSFASLPCTCVRACAPYPWGADGCRCFFFCFFWHRATVQKIAARKDKQRERGGVEVGGGGESCEYYKGEREQNAPC